MFYKLYLQRRIIALEERVAMLETKQEILLEALVKRKEKDNDARRIIKRKENK